MSLFVGLAFSATFLATTARAESFFNRGINPLAVNSGNFFRNGLNGFNNGFNGQALGLSQNGLGRFFGGLFNAQGNLDLTAGIPQAEPNFSRIAAANANNVGNNQEINIREFVTDPRSGFTTQQARLDPFTGLLQSRAADAFGNRFGGFNFGGLDNEAARQLQKFFMENITGVTVNNIEKRLKGFNNQEILELLAAVNLARQSLGPEASRGTVRIQCQDILMTAVNDGPGKKVDSDYAGLSPEDRCVAVASAAINHLKPPGKPPVVVNKSMLQNGTLVVPNLLRTFSLPALAVIFKKADNSNICNYERNNGSAVWALEDVVAQAMDPQVYNLAKGYDLANMNNNLFFGYGVNLATPRQAQGALGVGLGLFASRLTDNFFIDNRESGVARSGLTREGKRWENAVGSVAFTFDTNGEQNGVKLASQNVRQTGRNNLGFGQGEGFIYGKVQRDGTCDQSAFATAAPDENGLIKVANEVPATAAHAGAIGPGASTAAIVVSQCIKCHNDGPATIDQQGGPYTALAINGTNTVASLSGGFTNDRNCWQKFKQVTNQFIADTKSKVPGRSKNVLWDAYEKIRLPKSLNYAANQLGMSGDQLRGMMAADPSLAVKLQLDKDGNIDSRNWVAGGKCAIKFAQGGRRGGGNATGALASAVGPAGSIGDPDAPASEEKKPADETPHI